MTDLSDMLERGFLPKELPPPFNSKKLSLIFDANGVINTSVNPSQPGKLAEHNLARTGSLRRKLSFPNPVHYAKLCSDITLNYAHANAIYSKSKYSLSLPVQGQERSFDRKIPMSDLPFERVRNRSGGRYILKTDITRFYQSIYTHSIPWAIHTKNIAKADHGNHLCGNVIDRDVREAQDRQTMGIPIGPDSSFIIAEMILCEIDSIVASRIPTARGLRYVDDYEFIFSTIGEGEGFLGVLQEALNIFELEINPKKTEMFELPTYANAPWASELQSFTFQDFRRGQAFDIIRYFDRSFELSKKYPDQNVLKYSISRISTIEIDSENWSLVEGYIFQIMVVESGAMPHGLKLIKEYQGKSYKIELDRLEYVLNKIIEKHLPQIHGSEIAWAIWACIEFSVKINEDNAIKISDSDDSIVLLVFVDAYIRKLVIGNINFSKMFAKINPRSLYDSNWLFAYEADNQNWFLTNKTIINSDPAYKLLNARGVSFYDKNASIIKLQLSKSGGPNQASF